MSTERLDKQAAADFLGCSPRQLERYTKDNQIGVTYEKGRTRPTPFYDREELAQFKAKQERPEHRPVVMSGANATQGDNGDGALSLLPQPAQLEALSKLFALMQGAAPQDATTPQERAVKPTAAVESKLVLTLAECSALTGYSVGKLKAAFDADELHGHRDGRIRRVKRSDLDKWVETL